MKLIALTEGHKDGVAMMVQWVVHPRDWFAMFALGVFKRRHNAARGLNAHQFLIKNELVIKAFRLQV